MTRTRSTLVATALAALVLGLPGPLPVAGAAGAAGSAGPAPRAGVAITLGQVVASPVTCAPITVFQNVVKPNTPGYVVPAYGVVTSFSTNANATPGQVRLTAFVPGAAGNHYTLTGKSPLEPVVPNGIDSFSVRVPVAPGQILGLQTTANGMGCVGSSPGESVLGNTFDPDTSSDLVAQPFANVRVNLSAVVEPDVDGDGFGDLSQDLCPQSAKTQAPCPAPDTKIRRKPRRHSDQHSVTVTFSSSVKKAKFQCSLDQHRFKRCRSPYQTRLGNGTHTFAVRAVSAVGVPDPTPASAKFSITRKK